MLECNKITKLFTVTTPAKKPRPAQMTQIVSESIICTPRDPELGAIVPWTAVAASGDGVQLGKKTMPTIWDLCLQHYDCLPSSCTSREVATMAEFPHVLKAVGMLGRWRIAAVAAAAAAAVAAALAAAVAAAVSAAHGSSSGCNSSSNHCSTIGQHLACAMGINMQQQQQQRQLHCGRGGVCKQL